LTEQNAARLYQCFIQDTFSHINVLKGIDIIAAYTPKGMAARAKKIAPPGITIIPQKGKDLGGRLQNIFSQLFSIGYKKITIIGTDSPDLPVEYIKKSFAMLKGKTELVLGPAEDGGYYLIAMSKERKEIFRDIPWSTNIVFKKTMKKAKRVGLKAAILPKWYDVDNIDSLKVLRDNLKIRPVAAKTDAMLKSIFND
ncbi:MAG: TIGR04282 family arsenosugar biosynthesis glycosyltransferase, partial [Deltaproteobacteria bacterium]|nr:TIGR04282 family arsenosugar biosynthesis glycosyltransferase [Deltaproteobacteria bacterium]